MEDVTVIIQGRLYQESYDYYIKTYKGFKVIISTWIDNTIDFKNLPDNFKVILSPYPKEIGGQNLNYQITSTLNGLEAVTTKYTIKVRGDEYWSNLESVLNRVKHSPNKLHTSSVYFRAWSHMQYHISDHMIAGTTENMKVMFESSKYNFDNKLITYLKNGVPETYWEPELNLTRSYLMAKEPDKFGRVDGRILMREHFDILDVNLLKPYKIKVNLFKVEFYDNFIPEQNYSISTINQLFSDDPYNISKI